jgi:hypothetical protein
MSIVTYEHLTTVLKKSIMYMDLARPVTRDGKDYIEFTFGHNVYLVPNEHQHVEPSVVSSGAEGGHDDAS